MINLRYKHYQARLIDTINMVLEERKKIKMEQQRAEARGGMVSPNPNSSSASMSNDIFSKVKAMAQTNSVMLQQSPRSPSGVFMPLSNINF